MVYNKKEITLEENNSNFDEKDVKKYNVQFK